MYRRSGFESFPSEVSLASKRLHSGIILFIHYIIVGGVISWPH